MLVCDDTSFAIAQDIVAYKSARLTWSVSQYIYQRSTLVAAHIDSAMCHIYAGITSLDGAIDTAVFHISADNIITHTERNDLFVMKNILYHHDRTVFLSICLFV